MKKDLMLINFYELRDFLIKLKSKNKKKKIKTTVDLVAEEICKNFGIEP